MNRFSNFLRSYSPHGRHAMLIALGDMFLSILVISNAMPNIFDKDNIDLTYDFMGKSPDAERRVEIWHQHISLTVIAILVVAFATFLGIGIVKRSPRWISVWLVANCIFIGIAFGLAIAEACAVPIIVLLKGVLPFGSAVIYRSLQCWSVKEVHWELKSTRILLQENKDIICCNCEDNIATV